MPPATRAKKPVVPDAPTLDGVSAAVARAFAAAIRKYSTLDAQAKATRAFATALRDDPAARDRVHACASSLAHALAALGTIEALGPKTRRAAFERVHVLEWIVTSLRCAGVANDAALIELATAVGDGPIRGLIASVLRGGQVELPPSTSTGLAALFDTSRDQVALRCAFGAAWDRDPEAARAVARRLLEQADDEARIVCVIAQVEHAESDHAAWTPLIAPLVLSGARAVRVYASHFLAKQKPAFHAFVAWVHALAEPALQRRALAELAPQVYWAFVANRDIRDELVPSLRALRERAVASKDGAGVTALDVAAKKTGIDLGVSGATQPARARAASGRPRARALKGRGMKAGAAKRRAGTLRGARSRARRS